MNRPYNNNIFLEGLYRQPNKVGQSIEINNASINGSGVEVVLRLANKSDDITPYFGPNTIITPDPYIPPSSDLPIANTDFRLCSSRLPIHRQECREKGYIY